MKKMKKGFTIVELVIVIAVIAILSSVLIPVFSNIVNKANVSADQQAIRQMNTALAIEGVENENVNIFDVYEVLAEAGMDAKDYKALSSGMSFFWDGSINRVLYVDNATGLAVYPEEHVGRANNGKWQSLTQKIKETKPAAPIVDKAVTVENGNELAYAISNYINDDGINTIKLDSDVDMMGAAFAGGKIENNLTIESADAEPVTIKNVTAAKAEKTFAEGGAGHDGIYNAGFFATIPSGVTVTLRNVVIENVNVKDTEAGNIGFLVGELAGTLILDNVTIKNSSIIGHRNTGALVGITHSGAKIIIQGKVVLDNVSVQTVAGRSGMLVGFYNVTTVTTEGADAGIYMNNVTFSIYNCDLNTGVFNGTTLGLNNQYINAKKPKSAGGYSLSDYYYFANAIVGNYNNGITYNSSSPIAQAPWSAQNLINVIKPWASLNN